MSTLQIALAALVILLLVAWLWLRQRGDGARKVEAAADRIDTITGWPPQATRVLGNQERIAFGTLVRALPEYIVLAQVPLSRFINVPKRNSYADWLRRIGYQSVDFVICDMSAQVVAVIELHPAQQSERAKKRMTRIARTMKAAQIPLHVWRESALPSPEVAREALLRRNEVEAAKAKGALGTAPVRAPVTETATAAAAALAPPVAAAASARNPFEDTDRDSTQDEMIELLEPPPSTWYDDLDSDPVPLSKR